MSKQVMEMALEALKEPLLQGRMTPTVTQRHKQAIAALDEAIKQHDLADTYVQPVPDKCDRVIWRNNYYSLPIKQAGERCPTCGEDEPHTGTCGTSDNDTRALCKRKAAIKQAGEPVAEVDRDKPGGIKWVPNVALRKGTKLFTSAPTIPAGWQLVPKEPTPEMIFFADSVDWSEYQYDVYKAMLSAAPSYKGESND